MYTLQREIKRKDKEAQHVLCILSAELDKRQRYHLFQRIKIGSLPQLSNRSDLSHKLHSLGRRRHKGTERDHQHKDMMIAPFSFSSLK